MTPLIVCGDFGFIWNGSEKEKKILQKIGKMKPTIAFIPGCHDNYALLSEYPEVDFCSGKARHISGNLYELLRGQIYTIDNKTVFAFGGGISQTPWFGRMVLAGGKKRPPLSRSLRMLSRILHNTTMKLTSLLHMIFLLLSSPASIPSMMMAILTKFMLSLM